MITEDKVFRKLKETPEIFCIADDFCKFFDAQMAKYTFMAERKRKYHRESRMSKAEIMVIMYAAQKFCPISQPLHLLL